MKFFTLATACALIMATTVVGQDATPAPAPALDKRACTPSSCHCNGNQGEFCGNQAVNPACTNGDVFECNPSGATCNFGRRDSCVQCGKLSC